MARMGSQRQELMKIICEVLRCPFYIRGTPKHTEVKVDSVAYQGGGGNGPTLGTGNKECIICIGITKPMKSSSALHYPLVVLTCQ